MNIQPISFIIPSRTNLKYLKNSYYSIRKNLWNGHEICMADDASTDNTWDWMCEIEKKDKNVKIYKNNSGKRLGHTILYDVLSNEVSTKDIICIFHADMFAAKEMDLEMLKYLKPKIMVSATRIEPPLHPEEPNTKIIADFGIEPEEFPEVEFNNFVKEQKFINKGKMTNGVFAPWMCYKKDFQEINGHDPLFAPQSKEDDDLWNRFMLNGGNFIQSWEAYVYHLTCRGSRFANGAKRNLTNQAFMKGRETDEWLIQNHKSERNFVRKWGFLPHHTPEHFPIIPHKYDISFVVHNCSPQLLELLEPWCSRIYCDRNVSAVKYMRQEQENTMYDMNKRVLSIHEKRIGDIIVEFEGNMLSQEQFKIFITNLSTILDQGIEENSKYQYGIFNIKVNKVKHYDENLIVVDKNKTVR